eukprot:jgi/Orpsp1_1/1178539/evm.model.c7180000065750.1
MIGNSSTENDLPRIEGAVKKENIFFLEYLSENYEIKIQLVDEEILSLSVKKANSLIDFIYKNEMKLEDFKKLGPLLLYYETVEEVYQFLCKAHKKEKIFIKEITNEKKNSLILSIKQEILDDKLIYVDIELPEKKCNTDELLESLHHEINNLKGININLEEENKKIRNELKNTIEKFKQDYEKLKEENEKIKENNQRLNELFENTKAEYNKRKDNIQQILIPKIFDKLLINRGFGLYTRNIKIFEKDYYEITKNNDMYNSFGDIAILLIGNSSIENVFSRIGNDIKKENNFILEYLSEIYEINLQLKDGNKIILSIKKAKSFNNFIYKKEMTLEDFKKLGSYLSYYDTIEEVYQYFYEAFTEKMIFIKDIINKDSMILSVKQEILGKKLIFLDIALPEKMYSREELIENLCMKIKDLKEINKRLENENKNDYEKVKEDFKKMKEDNENIKEDNKKINEFIEKSKKEGSDIDSAMNAKPIIISKIYDKIYTINNYHYGCNDIYTRKFQKFGKEDYSVNLGSHQYFIIFLIGYDQTNYYLYRIQFSNIYSQACYCSIQFPIKFQFCYNINIKKSSDLYTSIGSSYGDHIKVNSVELFPNDKKIITISELTVLPKNAYYIVLPKNS